MTRRYTYLGLLLLVACSCPDTALALRRPIMGKTDEEISANYDPVNPGKRVTLLDADGRERYMDWHVLDPRLGVASSKMYWLDKSENREMRVEFEGTPPRYMTVGFNRKGKACCAVPNFSRPAEFTRFLENQALWRKCSQSHILLEVFPTIKALETRSIKVPNLDRDQNGRLILGDPHHVIRHEKERARVTRHVRYTSKEDAYATYIEKEDTWDRTYRQKYEPIFVKDAIRRGRKFINKDPKPPEIEYCMVADAETFWAWTLGELTHRFGIGATAMPDNSRDEGRHLRDISYEDAALQQLGGPGVKARLQAAVAAALRSKHVSFSTLEHFIMSAARRKEAEVIPLLARLVDRLPHQARDRTLWILGVMKGAVPGQAKLIPESTRKRITELQQRFDIDGDNRLSSAETRNARHFLSK